jgi:hypothetical protein
MGLPSAETLSLSEAVRLVVERCGCSDTQAEEALHEAGLNDQLVAYGFAPLTILSRVPDHFPRRRREDLRSGDWVSEIDWRASRIGRYADVRIMLSSIESWLIRNQGAEASQTPAPGVAAEVPNIVGQQSLAVGESASAANSPKSALRDETGKEYERHQRRVREQTGYDPTEREDEDWRKEQRITRQRMRDLRKAHRSPESKKGGRPRKKPLLPTIG